MSSATSTEAAQLLAKEVMRKPLATGVETDTVADARKNIHEGNMAGSLDMLAQGNQKKFGELPKKVDEKVVDVYKTAPEQAEQQNVRTKIKNVLHIVRKLRNKDRTVFTDPAKLMQYNECIKPVIELLQTNPAFQELLPDFAPGRSQVINMGVFISELFMHNEFSPIILDKLEASLTQMLDENTPDYTKIQELNTKLDTVTSELTKLVNTDIKDTEVALKTAATTLGKYKHEPKTDPVTGDVVIDSATGEIVFDSRPIGKEIHETIPDRLKEISEKKASIDRVSEYLVYLFSKQSNPSLRSKSSLPSKFIFAPTNTATGTPEKVVFMDLDIISALGESGASFEIESGDYQTTIEKLEKSKIQLDIEENQKKAKLKILTDAEDKAKKAHSQLTDELDKLQKKHRELEEQQEALTNAQKEEFAALKIKEAQLQTRVVESFVSPIGEAVVDLKNRIEPDLQKRKDERATKELALIAGAKQRVLKDIPGFLKQGANKLNSTKQGDFNRDNFKEVLNDMKNAAMGESQFVVGQKVLSSLSGAFLASTYGFVPALSSVDAEYLEGLTLLQAAGKEDENKAFQVQISKEVLKYIAFFEPQMIESTLKDNAFNRAMAQDVMPELLTEALQSTELLTRIQAQIPGFKIEDVRRMQINWNKIGIAAFGALFGALLLGSPIGLLGTGGKGLLTLLTLLGSAAVANPVAAAQIAGTTGAAVAGGVVTHQVFNK